MEPLLKITRSFPKKYSDLDGLTQAILEAPEAVNSLTVEVEIEGKTYQGTLRLVEKPLASYELEVPLQG